LALDELLAIRNKALPAVRPDATVKLHHIVFAVVLSVPIAVPAVTVDAPV